MARRKARNGSKKLQPAELDLYFAFAPNSSGNGFVDIAQQLSIINRKFFRQGYQYVIQEMELFGSNPADVWVSRLPHHWPMVNAWTKSMALWKQQQDEALEAGGLEDTQARFRDFKVYVNQAHADAGFGANLVALPNMITPGAGNGDYISTADAVAISPTVRIDWDPSQVVIPNDGGAGITNEYYLHVLGDDNGATSKGMIKAYAESRNRPQQTDPNIVDVPTGGLFGEMFDVGNDSVDVITNAQDHNHRLPYLNDDDSSFEFYPGGANTGFAMTLEGILSISATGDRVIGSKAPGFMANCGLLNLSWANASETQYAYLKITLAPGNYKGVMARPMQDVN